MTTVLLILLGLVIAGAIVFFLMKSGKIADKDGNNIPDVIDETIKDVKETVAVVEKVVKNITKPSAKKPEVKSPTEKKPTKKATTKKK
jgi:hypothetical protein